MTALFVHGVPDTHRVWQPVLDALAARGVTDVATVDLPGFGCPRPPGFAATKEAYVDWLVAELEARPEPVDLVGHDWGSLLVCRVASLRPDLIRTWTAGGGPVDPEYVWHDTAQLWQTPEVGEQVIEMMVTANDPEMFVGAGVPLAHAEVTIAHLDDVMGACILDLYRSAVSVGAEWGPDLAAAARRPGLLLWGRDDPYAVPESGERMAALSGARLILLPTGHWWELEAPATVADHLLSHWRSVSDD